MVLANLGGSGHMNLHMHFHVLVIQLHVFELLKALCQCQTSNVQWVPTIYAYIGAFYSCNFKEET